MLATDDTVHLFILSTIHSFIHLLINTECLFCTKYWVWYQGFNSKSHIWSWLKSSEEYSQVNHIWRRSNYRDIGDIGESENNYRLPSKKMHILIILKFSIQFQRFQGPSNIHHRPLKYYHRVRTSGLQSLTNLYLRCPTTGQQHKEVFSDMWTFSVGYSSLWINTPLPWPAACCAREVLETHHT